MLQALIVSNGRRNLDRAYIADEGISYAVHEVSPERSLDLTGKDVLVVPNGSDQIDLGRNRDAIRAFLHRGGMVCCFDGFFTDWIPGNRWIMDSTKRTSELDYRIRSDRHRLMSGVDRESLAAANGVRGWWACGYIDPAPGAETVLEDGWGRSILVVDDATTPGVVVMTCSGPCADRTTATEDAASIRNEGIFYRNLVGFALRRHARKNA